MRPVISPSRTPFRPRRNIVRPVRAHGLDFQLFRDATAPLLKAGYFGAVVYFGLQWQMFRDITAAFDDKDDDDDKDQKSK